MSQEKPAFLIQNKQWVCFLLEERLFGIDIFMTREILQLNSMSELRRLPNSPRYLEGIIDLRGELIPVLNAREILPVDYMDLNPRKEILVISKKNEKDNKTMILGLLVDRTENIVDLNLSDMQSLPDSFEWREYILGTLQMEDGRELYLLDPEKIILELQEKLLQKQAEEKLMAVFKKPKGLSLEEESSIVDFLDSVKLTKNSAIQKGVFRYFIQKRWYEATDLETLISIEKQKYESEKDSVFQASSSSCFFERENYFSVLNHVLQNWVLPKAREKKKLEIVNLSCGKGFDLYSLLFLLKMQLKDFDSWEIRVLGTSENEEELSFAKGAVYEQEPDQNIEQELFANIQSIYWEDLFEQTDRGYKILSEIQRNAEFEWVQRKKIDFFRKVDLVFTSALFLAKMDEDTVQDFVLGLNQTLKSGAFALFREIEYPLVVPETRLQMQEYRGYPYYLMR